MVELVLANTLICMRKDAKYVEHNPDATLEQAVLLYDCSIIKAIKKLSSVHTEGPNVWTLYSAACSRTVKLYGVKRTSLCGKFALHLNHANKVSLSTPLTFTEIYSQSRNKAITAVE